MNPKEVDMEFEEQVEELIREILIKYGYDFRGYARASMLRRITRFIQVRKINDMSVLRESIFKDSSYFESFVQEVTVNVTEMFRDPSFFLSLRNFIIPRLSTYPYIKIWDAGCSTGEELFSLAIILKEEGLWERTKIYATDINQKVLRIAKEGIFSAKEMPSYTANYYASGGKQEFAKYYTSNYGHIKFDLDLTKHVVFYPHNLATDSSFNEFHLILCRNVLIYFNKDLQDRVLSLFDESLISLGYLGLGKKESLFLSKINHNYELVDKENKIYKKIY